MKAEKIINVEIRGVYDGVAFTYNQDTKEFVWRDIVIERTTAKFRKDFEEEFIKNNVL